MGVTIPEGYFVDHINHIRDDNRWENLRLVSASGNSRNRGMSSRNTSGVTGVTWSRSKSRWVAQIKVDKENKTLGVFTDFSEAVNARKNAEVLYGFHENHGKDV